MHVQGGRVSNPTYWCRWVGSNINATSGIGQFQRRVPLVQPGWGGVGWGWGGGGGGGGVGVSRDFHTRTVRFVSP
jgi:hypothetical protein